MGPLTVSGRRYECCAIVHTETVEDYLKSIYKLATQGGATTVGLAEQLAVAAPSVSAMLKRLEADGLIRRGSEHGVELTAHGTEHALAVVRRHRLVEEFLAKVLSVPWEEVHAEAEALEHALSDRLVERIDAFLGHPSRDPHGDPIPQPGGRHDERWTESLAEVSPGNRFRVDRVSDRDSAALRFLGELGIRPGVVLEVLERAPFGGPLWIGLDGERHALGAPLADIVHGRRA